MFIAPRITSQPQLRRSGTIFHTRCAPTEQENVNKRGIYKHFIPTGLIDTNPQD
jgi:hypothetical protein